MNSQNFKPSIILFVIFYSNSVRMQISKWNQCIKFSSDDVITIALTDSEAFVESVL